MGRKKRPPPAAFEELRGRFDGWRRNRTGRNLPEELWQAATELAEPHGVSRVAQALGLHYARLRDRVEKGRRSSGEELVAKPTFVEVKTDPVYRDTPEYVVELEDPEAGKMTIRLKGASTAEVAQLAAAFWRKRR